MKYLHEVGPGIYHLDHRLTPEVKAMMASMASRLPAGGIKARYAQVVEAVYEGLCADAGHFGVGGVEQAEDRLTTYPLHPRVQSFFDKFVGMYGHSSIQEQTGDPAVYIEGISWYTAWLLFDSPLVKGQEFSTRAVRHKDWPMARECAGGDFTELHQGWMEIFNAEVDWWRDYFSESKNREAHGISDKEPFRPALDRARWALPGTVSTGACFTSDLRERSRVLRYGYALSPPQPVWHEIIEGYKKSTPGIACHALNDVVAEGPTPAHWGAMFSPLTKMREAVSVHVLSGSAYNDMWVSPPERSRARQYHDPWRNRDTRVHLRLECSLAAARDWHRHRTMYPMDLGVVVTARDKGNLTLADGYGPRSETARHRSGDLWRLSTEKYYQYLKARDTQRAALALPFGTRVRLSGVGGYRDVIYALELRANAHGANFEYQGHAKTALDLLGVSRAV
jgi:hypothetical protein